MRRRWSMPHLIRSAKRWRRGRARREVVGLANLLVLLQIAIAGGLSPRAALQRLAPFASSTRPLGTACASTQPVVDRLALGADFADALIAAERADEMSVATYRVLDLLRRSEVDGEPLAVPLEMLLVDFRRQRENALDEAAQRLTVLLLFPLVLCILPAFIVLAIVPLVITALSGLAG